MPEQQTSDMRHGKLSQCFVWHQLALESGLLFSATLYVYSCHHTTIWDFFRK